MKIYFKVDFNLNFRFVLFFGYIVFIVLKLTNLIDLSWKWVLSPLWVSATFILFFGVTVLSGLVILFIVKKICRKPFEIC